MSPLIRLAAGFAAGLVLSHGPTASAQTQAPTHATPAEQVQRMGRGVNVLGYDPLWNEGGQARFKTRHFAAIRQAGFSTIRVNLQAFRHMDAKNRLDARWFKTLDWIVESANAQGLNVILDEHDFEPCGKDAAACKPRLLAFWRQVGDHYKAAPDSVIFELLNEPNGQLDDAAWNDLMAETLAVVRRSNPTRIVVIGPAFWNNINHLEQLKLPAADRNIVVTVHYYLPMEFTHQGASWNPATAKLHGVTWGAPAEQARLDADLDGVQRWSKANDRPILLGEFGAYDDGDTASRVRYTSAVARGAEARGWAWAYWQFDGNFIAYDMKADAWVQPILKALAPDSPAVK